MGELTYNGRIVRQERVPQVSMALAKVEIHLTKDRIIALSRIMSSYLSNMTIQDIDDRAIYLLIYSLYETKIRKKLLTMKPGMKMTLDMPQAWAMFTMFQEMDLSAWPYEESLKELIVYEINQQTL
ncbi:MAG: hypothetical protein WCO44_12495 [Bacteroidota bacterium]